MRRSLLQVVFVIAIITAGQFHSLDGQTGTVPEQVFIPIPATLSVTQNDVIVDGTFFLPENIGRIRAVIVVIRAVLGQQVYQDPKWRTLAEDLRCGLLLAGIANGGPPVPNRPLKDHAVRNAAVGG